MIKMIFDSKQRMKIRGRNDYMYPYCNFPRILYVNVSRIKEKKNLLVVDVVRSVRANIAWRKNKANVRGHEREFS